MEPNTIQVLQADMRAIAKTYQDLAAQILVFSRHIGALQASDMDEMDDEWSWEFDQNDYSTLSTWLVKDPWAQKHKAKHPTESWPVYAIRISKYVGWDVDDKTLRRSIERKMGK